MSYYPILVDLEGQKAVVVGGGRVAQRKIEGLLAHGARVQVVARELTPSLIEHVKNGRITHPEQEFAEGHLDGAFIVIAATDDPLLNRRVSEAAKERGILVNAVDQPADCNFIVPSLLRRGDLLVAVSTSGKSPAFARKVRKGLEERFGPEYGTYLALMGRLRKEILARRLSGEENRKIFHDLVESPILDALGDGDWNKATSIVNGILGASWSREDVMEMAAADTPFSEDEA